MKKISWPGNAMQFALDHVSAGVLLVDADGRVWRTGRWPAGLAEQVWRQFPVPKRAENINGKGYLRVALWIEDERRLVNVMAHRLVYTLRFGAISKGMQINHKDLNKTNNHPDNLEVVTNLENMRHALANGAFVGSHAKMWAKRRLRAVK